MGSCIHCPAGQLCETTEMTAPAECPIGYYCPANTAITIQEGYDYVGNDLTGSGDGPFAGTASDLECASYCQLNTLCFGWTRVIADGACTLKDSNYLAGIATDALKNSGPKPTGASPNAKIECPAGTYGSVVNSGTVDECTMCPVGMYCTGIAVAP